MAGKMKQYRWQYVPADYTKVAGLKQSLNIPNFLCELLIKRGIETYDQAKQFFRPSLKDLHDYNKIKDINKAVERISKAIEQQEKVLLVGDYDVDGTTSTAILYSFLKPHLLSLSYHIPNRFKEGYGLSEFILKEAVDQKVQLVITMDCGVKSQTLVNQYNETLDFIICDHHLPDEILPKAVAVVNPKRSDCHYPYKELPACGVVFKLVQAINEVLRLQPSEKIFDYLDWVAMAVGADLVPMKNENRVLMSLGLKKINQNPSMPVKVLKQNAGYSEMPLSTREVVFGLAPRINALGRLYDAKYAVEYLCQETEEDCLRMVGHIEQSNITRRQINEEQLEEALEMLKSEGSETKTTVLYHPDWHQGILGILASKLQSYEYKPTIILTKDEKGTLVGSARSVKGFDIYEAIYSCKELLNKFGGHQYAAGLSLEEKNYAQFKGAFEKIVLETILPECLTPCIEIDSEITFKDIHQKSVSIIEQMAPFGPEALAPRFLIHNVQLCYKPTIVKEKFLRATFVQNDIQFPGFFFSLPQNIPLMNTQSFYSIVCKVEFNRYKGQKTIQLIVEDIEIQDIQSENG